eukprot:TRINITY_DN19920_c0_g1_i1.p1 TRINITY_DN19920_c0_g1~~TRINITY_DN19920_c0_g1_i1.p1  ORF type:complete len:449 (+),score=110.18 TRINITY_DN19920_c0_g1_i1:46-1347(+)
MLCTAILLVSAGGGGAWWRRVGGEYEAALNRAASLPHRDGASTRAAAALNRAFFDAVAAATPADSWLDIARLPPSVEPLTAALASGDSLRMAAGVGGKLRLWFNGKEDPPATAVAASTDSGRVELLTPDFSFVLPADSAADVLSRVRALCEAADVAHRIPDRLRAVAWGAEEGAAAAARAAKILADVAAEYGELAEEHRAAKYGWLRKVVRALSAGGEGIIVVPGSGLGRFAADVAADGRQVVAVDSDAVAAAVATHFTGNDVDTVVHPWLHRPWATSLATPLRSVAGASPRIVVGRYPEALGALEGRIAGVATSWLIDACGDPFQLVAATARLLRSNGRQNAWWANDGPLAYPGAAWTEPQPAWEEVQAALTSAGFTVVSTGTRPCRYQHYPAGSGVEEVFQCRSFVALLDCGDGCAAQWAALGGESACLTD